MLAQCCHGSFFPALSSVNCVSSQLVTSFPDAVDLFSLLHHMEPEFPDCLYLSYELYLLFPRNPPLSSSILLFTRRRCTTCLTTSWTYSPRGTKSSSPSSKCSSRRSSSPSTPISSSSSPRRPPPLPPLLSSSPTLPFPPAVAWPSLPSPFFSPRWHCSCSSQPSRRSLP